MATGNKPNDEEPEEGQDKRNESDDTFGLPEIEYEPINRDPVEEEPPQEEIAYQREEEVVYQEEPVHDAGTEAEPEPVFSDHEEEQRPTYQDSSSYNYSYSHETSSPVWPKALLIVLLILAVVGAGLWYFLYYQPKQEEERRIAAAQLAEREAAFQLEKARKDSLQRLEDLRRSRLADSLANIPKTPPAGTIDTLEGRTGLYYVVIASDIDDDLLLDYAKKLSGKGVSSTIIPPHGRVKFFRLAVANGDSFANAQSAADELKGEYGSGVWVTKY